MVKTEKPTITIVQQDRGEEETILEIAFALDSFQNIASNIFDTVESNLEKSKQRLANLQSRCLAVKSKVEKLTGINKSITVYSSSKYPGTSRDRVYKYEVKDVVNTRPNVKVNYKPLPPEKLSLREKLKFYHVKDRTLQLKKNVDIVPLEGLGPIPQDIKSVSSLLLFNTNQNLYENYKLLDPLSNAFKSSKVEENAVEVTEIEPAPVSILFNDETTYKVDRNFFYSPSLQNVPQIEAPLDLPDLPGIAGDLRYCVEHPSLELQLSEEAGICENTDDDVTLIVENLPKLDNRPTETQSPPPPPPQPPPPPPPPPPPVPPPSQEPETDSKNIVHDTSEQKVNPTLLATDMRANLMEAIRNAGGSGKAKLRSVSTVETSSGSNKIVKKEGGNLMDDLHAKLSMRRKGISGKMDNPEGLMEKMVSMIPPPPSKEQELEVDDEWDD